MNANWIEDYERASSNALTVQWFVSPLEFVWGNGKELAGKIFSGPSTPNVGFDEAIAPHLYRTAMECDFRAKMMVYAFMREPIAMTYALEIESGLIRFFGLDFPSCLSQWIYVIEGYARQLFQIESPTEVRSKWWTVPETGNETADKTIEVVCRALGRYLDSVVYRGTRNNQAHTLNRHLLLHGNLQNKGFFNQKNCLAVMFVLDALVFVEMVRNGHFPQAFQDGPGEADRIQRRTRLYASEVKESMHDLNLLRRAVLEEHV